MNHGLNSLSLSSSPASSKVLRQRRWRHVVCAASLCAGLAVLSGCAGQVAFREGQRLLAQDHLEDGLTQLQQAINADPQSGEYQRTYLLARERAVTRLLEQAERQQAADHRAEAAQLYQRVQVIQPDNPLARQGLLALERQERQVGLLAEATRAVQSRDWSAARSTLDAVLRVDPVQPQALALQAQIAAQTAAPPADTGLRTAFRKPISIEFRDVPLRQAFDVLSKGSGLNFVFDKDVKADQKLTMLLRDSTVEAALHFLLITNQLEQQVMNGNTLLIYPNTPAKLKDYQELSVRTFHMANTDAKAVAATLKTLFKGRDVVVDDRANMLVVRDTPEALRMVEKLVALHDVPEPEVILEVEILEVSRAKLLELGVRWPDSLTLAPLATDTSVGLTLKDLTTLGSTRIGATVSSPVLNARKEDTDVNLLASPRIRVLNREKAKVLIGEKLPVVSVTSSPTGGFAEAVTYIDVGLKLEVEPTIYRGNDIVIKLGLEVSNIAGSTTTKLGGLAYTLGTRNVNTVLRLRNGENQVLAGLINDEDRKTANKLPGLGELPVAGRLFGSTLDDGKKTEIVLSITPRLVRNINRPESSLLEFRSGTEGNLRERPAEPVALPSPDAKRTP